MERGISDGYFAGSAPSPDGLLTKVIVHCQKGQLRFLYIVVLFRTILRKTSELVLSEELSAGPRIEHGIYRSGRTKNGAEGFIPPADVVRYRQ